MKVLLAVDGSECSALAVNEVAARQWPRGTEVRIISVIEPVIPVVAEPWAVSGSFYDQALKVEEDRANEAIKLAINQIEAENGAGADASLKISSCLLNGFAKDAILDDAEKWGADLIVIGSHGYRGITRFLLGSVSQAVANHANCSVHIARCKRN
jgi:nucleotide-binding universal stress UspA family protein